MEVAEKKIKVIIADDHEIFLMGLNSLFKKNEKYEVVGVVSDAQDIFSVVEKTKPDLLIIDFLMPGANGIDVIQMLKAKTSGLKSILISNIEDRSIIKIRQRNWYWCRKMG
jgi:DNA-binding NarL/FixJ family response regulator